jgi:hypothetical protein
MPIAANIANCDLAQMPAALRKIPLRAAQYSSGDGRYWMWIGYSSGSAADLCGQAARNASLSSDLQNQMRGALVSIIFNA